ncbi:ClC family H(+)/Cl(-) exchange transporter [Turicibacter sanguinis]|uniref:ClC family H(+)/Cl(-) exchange transporter n=1 Tax=Turicibacter sanguinis TaxID=154288 RepID=UPI00232FC1FB|nr:ClC family H(+)/Cl(-) exchange transporter [Turicibacter sanguinis]MDB8459224.1 ClC family H(+)/Cl(-) exchange transporter [Turicibacter sanguinis]
MNDRISIRGLITQFDHLKLKLAMQGILVGIASGFMVVFYRMILEKAEHIRQLITLNQPLWMIGGWFILLVLAALFVGRLMIKDPMICGSGIPQVEGVLANKLNMNPVSVLIRKFIGGTLCIGAGLSVGREGPSIQLGAATAQWMSRLFKRPNIEEKYLITSGASAGLAAAFNAPLAGVMFSLEEVHKHFSPLILVSAMSASLTADFISKHFFGLKPVFQFNRLEAIPLTSYGLIVILGIITGLCGVFYNKITEKTLDTYDSMTWLKKQYRPIIPFLMAGVLLFVLPEVLGGGHSLVESLTEGNFTIAFILILLMSKFIFSMISFGSSVPGGIFFPLLVLGALTGALFGNVLSFYFGIDEQFIQNFIILAMAGYFTAIVRAPMTGIILITEMTGSFSHLLSLSLISLISYTVAELFRSEPIYETLLHRILKSSQTDSNDALCETKTLLEVPIFFDSFIDGKCVKDLALPENCLLVSVKRGNEEIIPRGNTLLHSGDILIVLVNEAVAGTIRDDLLTYCDSTHIKTA